MTADASTSAILVEGTPCHRNRAAFTLLEVLVVVLLVAMILVAANTALSTGVLAYRRSRNASERDAVARSAIHILARDCRHAILQAPGAAPSLLGTFAADSARGPLLRLRVSEWAPTAPREMQFDYFLMPAGPGRSDLVRRSAPLGESDEQAYYELLATGIVAASLRYFDGQQWTDRWDSSQRDAPPRLVEVTLEFPRADGRTTSYMQAIWLPVAAPLILPRSEEGRP